MITKKTIHRPDLAIFVNSRLEIKTIAVPQGVHVYHMPEEPRNYTFMQHNPAAYRFDIATFRKHFHIVEELLHELICVRVFVQDGVSLYEANRALALK